MHLSEPSKDAAVSKLHINPRHHLPLPTWMNAVGTRSNVLLVRQVLGIQK